MESFLDYLMLIVMFITIALHFFKRRADKIYRIRARYEGLTEKEAERIKKGEKVLRTIKKIFLLIAIVYFFDFYLRYF